MINPETRAQIRRYFYAEHWKVGTIAAELSVHPDAVRNAIATAGKPVDGKAAGAYGRITGGPVIDYSAIDIAVLVK